MTLTPSTKGSFIAGIGLWCLAWAAVFKADDIAELGGIKRWVNSERCLRWISKHKSTSLIGTELCNHVHTGAVGHEALASLACGEAARQLAASREFQRPRRRTSGLEKTLCSRWRPRVSRLLLDVLAGNCCEFRFSKLESNR